MCLRERDRQRQALPCERQAGRQTDMQARRQTGKKTHREMKRKKALKISITLIFEFYN